MLLLGLLLSLCSLFSFFGISALPSIRMWGIAPYNPYRIATNSMPGTWGLIADIVITMLSDQLKQTFLPRKPA